jgi:hypothetical protein
MRKLEYFVQLLNISVPVGVVSCGSTTEVQAPYSNIMRFGYAWTVANSMVYAAMQHFGGSKA